MDFLDIVREKAFLGREFLTWLWFKSEQTGGMIELPSKDVIELIFLDKMTLDLSDAETPQSVAIKGEHSQLREGLAALKEGKKIEEARISVKRRGKRFQLGPQGHLVPIRVVQNASDPASGGIRGGRRSRSPIPGKGLPRGRGYDRHRRALRTLPSDQDIRRMGTDRITGCKTMGGVVVRIGRIES